MKAKIRRCTISIAMVAQFKLRSEEHCPTKLASLSRDAEKEQMELDIYTSTIKVIDERMIAGVGKGPYSYN